MNQKIYTKQVSERVGKRLNQVRVTKKLTQEKLAFEAGLNRAYVGYIERGERNPSIATMAKLAKALDVKLYELFKI